MGDTRDTQTPAGIERESMRIIGEELSARGIVLPPDRADIVKRVIHATADFDFVEALRFTPGIPMDAPSLRGGVLVTDTHMALAGISRPALKRLDMTAHCFVTDEAVIRTARKRGTTRAAAAVETALEQYPEAMLAVGNAPTALLRLCDLMEAGARPKLVIAVPVGFVNVAESKEKLWEMCGRLGVPALAAMGRKGGSTVAVAVCNAVLYAAAGMSDPETRA